MRELSRDGLLGSEDVAELVGVKESTVWRWCREGTLPCLKVGKQWRVRRGDLEDFFKQSERPATLVGRLGSFLRVPDNVLAIAENRDILHRLDAAFLQVGEVRGGLLAKFYGGEDISEDKLLARFEERGLDARRLVDEGRLLMRSEEIPLGARGDQLGRFIEEEAGGGRAVWASFDWTMDVDLDTALEQQGRLAGLVDANQLVVKTATLEEAIGGWSPSALRRAQSLHSGTILASKGGLWVARATPLPPV